jgi:hypothetical protein
MSGTSSFTAVRKNSSVRNTRSKEAQIGTLSSAGHAGFNFQSPDPSTILVQSPLECDRGLLKPAASIIGFTDTSNKVNVGNDQSGRTYLFIDNFPSVLEISSNINSGAFGRVVTFLSLTTGNSLTLTHPDRSIRGIIYNAGVPKNILAGSAANLILDGSNTVAGDYINYDITESSILINAHAVNPNTIYLE